MKNTIVFGASSLSSTLLLLLAIWTADARLKTSVSTTTSTPLGISDASAIVGRLFNFSIPRNDISNADGKQYEVFQAGQKNLPSWLHFDNVSLSLVGVPLSEDVGRIYMRVNRATKDENGVPFIEKDVFSIEISENTGASSCVPGQVPTKMTVSIVINSPPPDSLAPLQRVQLLTSAAEFLHWDLTQLELSGLSEEQSALEPDALRAGPGNARNRNAQVSKIQIATGCTAAQVTLADSENLISLIEKSAADGTLGDSLGYPIVGWQATETSVERQKRYVTPCRGTPILEMHATIFPKVTERFFEKTSETTPESRIVPTMSSPHPTGPTLRHHHRHHHGQDPLRREHIPTPIDATTTPTWRYYTLPTARASPGGTPMPTPAVFPDRPTAIYPSRITIVDPTLRLQSTVHLPEVVMTRRYEVTTDYTTVDVGLTRSRITVEPTKTITQSTNFKPTVNSRMKKLSLVCGKAWSYTVPKDTFLDLEDGNTRALKLMFMSSERTSIPASSWIQFDPENQLLYALPLIENIGKHEYVLEAMDREGASTFDRVELHVWPHPSQDELNHAFSMTVRYNKWQYPVGIDWQTEIMNRLSLFFGDPDNARLMVLRVTLDPVRITWANDSLPTEVCPVDDIKYIYEALSTPDHHPTKEMRKLMTPEFRVQEISVDYRGTCEGVVTSPMPPPNFSPKVTRPIGRLNITVGDVLKYRIPEDTFYDFEDGSTRLLRLSFLTTSNVVPLKSHWVQFDPYKQELFGIASKDDVGKHQYRLIAMDADGQDVVETFEIRVQDLSPLSLPPVEFSVHLMEDFDEFMADSSRKTLVAFKIAQLYGDTGPYNVLVTSVTRGSVVYAFSNKTLPHDFCPKDQIDRLYSYLVNDDGSLTVGLVNALQPEFRVTRVVLVPIGVCFKGIAPTSSTVTTTERTGPELPDHPDATVKTISTTEDLYVTTVLPAAIITAVLLVTVILIVYCLYCRRTEVKDTAELDVDKEFVGGGVPVVFAGELEESKPDPGKAPAIMPNEKPPLTTDYFLNPLRRGAAAVRESVAAASQMHHLHQPQQQQVMPMQESPPPPNIRERRFVSRHEQQHSRKETTQLYQPPPPFTHGHYGREERKSTRPKVAPTYSRHPTYVPP